MQQLLTFYKKWNHILSCCVVKSDLYEMGVTSVGCFNWWLIILLTKWLPFSRHQLSLYFLEICFYQNCTEVCFKGPTDDKSALVEVMAWYQTGDKPSPVAMVTQIYIHTWHNYNVTDKNLLNSDRLTNCCIVTHYGSKDLGQHWLQQWCGFLWLHQTINWTNVNSSSMTLRFLCLRLCDSHLNAIWEEISKISIHKMRLKNTF